MMKQLPDYNSPSALSALLQECGFGMQKKFGQNFLINSRIRQELIAALDISASDTGWEVGPGLGAMTALLLESGARITAFEIDRGFASLLRTYFGNRTNFQLVEGDVLKTWQEAYTKQQPSFFFGNLPYNIAAKLIADTIEAECFFDRMVITVQKEVGMRMIAKPNSSDYSSFSVLCQWQYDIKPIRNITPAAFWPQPNVESQSLILKKKPQQQVRDTKLFFMLIRSLFAARRKTIKNNLTSLLKSRNHTAADAEAILHKAALDPCCRAETLSVYDFIRLSDILSGIHA